MHAFVHDVCLCMCVCVHDMRNNHNNKNEYTTLRKIDLDPLVPCEQQML
jgi:hypothetical protein